MKKSLFLLLVFVTLFTCVSCKKGDDSSGSDDFLLVTYATDGNGRISGNNAQLVPQNSSTEPVVAIADDGWLFIGWDDGYENPLRSDSNVKSDMVFTAIFVPIEEEEDGAGEGDTDAPDDAPQKPSDDSSENEDQQPQ